VGERDAGVVGHGDELLDDVDAVFVADVAEEVRTTEVSLLTLADASRQHSLGKGAPDDRPHAVALRDGQHFPLDAAAEDGLRGLLGAEHSSPRRSDTHCASTMFEAGKPDEPIARTLPLRTRSVRAERVSSISTVGSRRCTWYRSM